MNIPASKGVFVKVFRPISTNAEKLHKGTPPKNYNFVQKCRPPGEGRPFGCRLHDFSEGGLGLLLLGETPDDVLPGDDADEAVEIVHHRDKILADDGVQQLVHGGGDADGGVFPEDVPDVEPFQLLHGAGTRGAFVRQKPPEEIPLADGAYILALAVDDGDGAAAVMPELFQALAYGVVVVQVGDAMLRRQKVSDIHNDASFLMGRRAGPPGS